MGMFLALAGIIGKSQNEVIASLTNYTNSVGGGIQEDNTIDSENDNCCIVLGANNNTTIFYPYSFLEWDAASEFISRELNTTVFSLHIHDGDFWMYQLYNNGEVVDQFNPIPDYWDDNISDDEIENWKGNASIIANYVSYIKPKDIEKYLVRWDLDAEDVKAYQTDEYVNEDWQLIDFMRKLELPYPLDDDGKSKGRTYKFWTDKLTLKQEKTNIPPKVEHKEKPWWKFW